MSTLLAIVFAALVLNTLVGIVANGFIVLFICTVWFRIRKLSPADLILYCLGLSRFILQIIMILDITLFFFFTPTYLLKYTWIIINSILLLMNNLNLWFAALLSVLYFVKIGIFSHPVLLEIKQRFSRLFPWLLFGSIILSAAMAIMIMIISSYLFSKTCFYKLSSRNNNNSTATEVLNACKYSIIAFNFPSIIPFLLFLSSTIFVMSSLWKHIKHLQNSGICIKDLNTQVHLTAIKTLASFAVVYLSSLVAIIVQSVVPLIYGNPWAFIVFQNMSAIYLSGHAIILILVNPKLKRGCIRMLHHLKCCLCEAPS